MQGAVSAAVTAVPTARQPAWQQPAWQQAQQCHVLHSSALIQLGAVTVVNHSQVSQDQWQKDALFDLFFNGSVCLVLFLSHVHIPLYLFAKPFCILLDIFESLVVMCRRIEGPHESSIWS